jgi:peptidoglycan/xylan/chitin deacetylase (PgdA/CDA1 family)
MPRTYFARAFVVLFALSGPLAHGFTTTLTEKGVVVDAGRGGKFILPLPSLSAGKKAEPPSEVHVADRHATVKYASGASLTADLEVDGTLIFRLVGLSADVKSLKFVMTMPLSLAEGGTFAIDVAKPVAFPAATASSAFLYDGNCRCVTIAPAQGEPFALALESAWQQVLDMRIWKNNNFGWAAYANLPRTAGDQATCRLRIGNPKELAKAVPYVPAKSKFQQRKLADAAGSTIVLKWKDGKKGAFMLEFDDNAPSQLKNVIPELQKRGLVGTFYVVPGWDLFTHNRAAWAQAAATPAVVLANHSFTHKGLETVEQLDAELKKCNAVLNEVCPQQKQPRLISFGQPGGVKWAVTKEQIAAALVKYNLVARPPFFGPPFALKSAAEVLAVFDGALAQGEMAHLDFHGVGGDWLVTPMDWFIPLLDKMAEHKEEMWITDPISWHKYVTERDSAAVEVLDATAGPMRIRLTSKADPALYDAPLTLATRVPAGWHFCNVVQGTTQVKVAVADSQIKYDAVPGAAVIEIRRAD